MNRTSLCISISEFASLGMESLVVLGKEFSDLSLKWVICVRVLQECHQALNYKLGIKSGYPRVLNSLSADLASVLLDVWVKDLCLEESFRCFEGIVIWEIDVDNELSTFVWSVLWSNNGNVPVCKSFSHESDWYTLNGIVFVDVSQFLNWLSDKEYLLCWDGQKTSFLLVRLIIIN